MDGLSCDVAIAGGGLVGLSLAYELATLGAQVVVVDAAHPGRATDAGAGILSPDTNAEDEHWWWEFGHRAGAHYPDLLARMAADGADTDGTGYDTCGLISVGLRESERDWYDPFADRVTRRSGQVIREITPDEARQKFPPLGPVHRALYNPAAARVDGRGMADALRQAATGRGVRFVRGEVTGVTDPVGADAATSTRTVQHVQIDDHDDLACGALAVAGGAWSAAMGEWLGHPLPITPTKGQIVHLGVAGATGEWPIVQPLLTHYLVPWPGGRVACGGTFEADAGFSATTTAAGLHELLREGISVAPGLADAEYLHTRVGLRPTSSDDRPVVGALPGWSNVFVVTGHGASGLLLGPYSARLVAERITGQGGGGQPIPAGVDPARFR
jgi:D-amino-acid dehydrogenase